MRWLMIVYHANNTSNHNGLLWWSSEVGCTSNPHSNFYQVNIWIFNWWVECLIPLYIVQSLIWVLKISSFLQLSIQLIILPLFSTSSQVLYFEDDCVMEVELAIHIHVDKWPMKKLNFDMWYFMSVFYSLHHQITICHWKSDTNAMMVGYIIFTLCPQDPFYRF
jgi:hypothetical protein